MLQIFLKAERKCFQNEGWWGWGVKNFQQLHPLWRRERLCMIGYISRSSFILYPISIYIPPFPFGHYCWSTTSTLCCMESLLESRKWLFKSKYTHTLYASKVFLKTLSIINILKEGQQHMSDDKQNGLIMAVNCVLHIYNH